MTRKAPTADQLAKLAEKDLYYEVAMLLGAKQQLAQVGSKVKDFDALDRADPRRVERSVAFESTLLHCRVLDEFLTKPPRQSGSYSDSVWAGDYVAGWQPPNPGPLVRAVSLTPGQDVKVTINKQLTHFSLARLNQAKFYVDHIAEEVANDMRKFVALAISRHPSLSGVQMLLTR